MNDGERSQIDRALQQDTALAQALVLLAIERRLAELVELLRGINVKVEL
jgi:hypothetical protein